MEITDRRKESIRAKIVENLISLIYKGVLNKGDHLPSIREMSERYGLSRSTIVQAYKELESMGYIQGKERSCYLVLAEPADIPPAKYAETQDNDNNRTDSILDPQPEDQQRYWLSNRLKIHHQASLSPHFIRKWFREMGDNKEFGQGKASDERLTLKSNLARYIKITRGTAVRTDNMLVIKGQQEALALIALYGRRQKLAPSIIIEDPCAPEVFQLFQKLGYQVIPIKVGAEGIDVQSFPDHAVDFIYTSPSNSFPSGAQMSPRNRELLLAWSQRHQATIIENDACFMLGFGRKIIPSLRESYPASNVIYLYNFAELIGNSANLSLLVLPDRLFQPFSEINSLLSSDYTSLNSRMVCDFMGSTSLMKYLTRTLQVRQEKYELALSGLGKVIPQLNVWGLLHSGFFSFTAPAGSLPETLLNELLTPLTSFCQQPDPLWSGERYIYPLGALSLREIETVNSRLAEHHKVSGSR